MSFEAQRTKLLYVVNARVPNERANGIQIAHTCESIGARGVDLTLVTRFSWKKQETPQKFFGISETFTQRVLPAIDIPGIPFRYPVRNFSFFFFANLYVLAVFLVSLLSRKKLVVYVRGEIVLAFIPLSYIVPVFFETHQIRNYEGWYRFALERVQGIVVITEGLKQKFINEYQLDSRKILVARDAVNLQVFESAVKNEDVWSKHAVPKGRKVILYSGTLAVEKGVHMLAEAAARVSEDVQIVFLGGTEDQVLSFREKYGHIQNISILGRVDYQEVPTYVASADVLVLPDSGAFTYSNLYTSPMKLFEYMASGRPIIASSVPSLREVLDDTSATFFESEDAESLASKIQEVLSDESGSKGKAERARKTVSQFTWEKRAELITEHLWDCLSLERGVSSET